MSDFKSLVSSRAGGLLGIVRENPLLALVAAIGFSVSFQTVAHLAYEHGLPGWPPLYPVGIDIGILALLAEALYLIRDRRSDFIPRALAWVLSGFTVYVNAHGAARGDWVGAALHVAMPALWVVFLELVRHRRIAAQHADAIPFGRWAASPWPTLRLKMRMLRDGTTSYPVALEMEHARLFARDLLRAAPRQFRPARSSLIRKRVRTGRLTEDIRKAVGSSLSSEWSAGWEPAVTEWVTDVLGMPSRMAASLENANREAALKAAAAMAPEPVPVTPEPAVGAPAEAPAEDVSSQPAPPAPVTPRARTQGSRKGSRQSAPRLISDEELTGQVKQLLAADPDISIAQAAARLGRGRDRISPILTGLRNANVVPMERRQA